MFFGIMNEIGLACRGREGFCCCPLARVKKYGNRTREGITREGITRETWQGRHDKRNMQGEHGKVRQRKKRSRIKRRLANEDKGSCGERNKQNYDDEVVLR